MKGCSLRNWKRYITIVIIVIGAIFYYRHDQAINNFNMALKYLNGSGIQKDRFKAMELFEKSCNFGLADACTNLGSMYKNKHLSELAKNPNNNIPNQKEDYLKAYGYLEKACNGNSPKGCQGLAELYLDGLGIPQDSFKAVIYYKKACDKNTPWSCHMLGFIYENEKDMQNAKEYYKKACELDPEKLVLSCEKYKQL